jgi:hypothetical protein
VKKAILNLKLEDIVGECFDGAANMSGVHKGLATHMKECSPLVVYVHCYGHLLNLALQDSMTSIQSARNALGTVQKLYTFLEASPTRHRIFQDLEIEEDHINLTLKSLSATRWSCRWEAVRAVVEQITRIVQALISCSDDRDPTTYTDSNALLNQVPQSKNMDVTTAKKTMDSTIKTLEGC